METKNAKSEIIQKEKEYWQGMVNHDLNSVLRLTDFPCIVAGSHGLRLVDRATFTQMFESKKEEVQDYTFLEEPEVRLLSPDTAVIAYKIRATTRAGEKEQVIEAVDTSTWIRRDGHWACAMHTEVEQNAKLAG